MLLVLGDHPLTLSLCSFALGARLLQKLFDPCRARPRVSQLVRQLIAALIAIQLVFAPVGLDRLLDDPLSLRAQPIQRAVLL